MGILRGGIKVKLRNLAAQIICETFTTIQDSENKIKIIKLVVCEVTTLGDELKDRNCNSFAVLGDREKRVTIPPTILLSNSLLAVLKCLVYYRYL
mmetsp:Transcript_9500/g.11101  ORF Transcript_9500/g.11101 Transcript_9500/m.11101 type:complete len:95 (-) Transcript_9500:65-349(-)